MEAETPALSCLPFPYKDALGFCSYSFIFTYKLSNIQYYVVISDVTDTLALHQARHPMRNGPKLKR